MEKKEIKRRLEAVETIAQRLSGVLSSMSVWDVEDNELKSVISQYLAEYHIKAANLAIEYKNMD